MALSQNVHMLITSTQHYDAVWRQRDIERARVKIRVPYTTWLMWRGGVPGGAGSSVGDTCVDWTPSGLPVERLWKAGHMIQRGGESSYSGFTHNPSTDFGLSDKFPNLV